MSEGLVHVWLPSNLGLDRKAYCRTVSLDQPLIGYYGVYTNLTNCLTCLCLILQREQIEFCTDDEYKSAGYIKCIEKEISRFDE